MFYGLTRGNVGPGLHLPCELLPCSRMPASAIHLSAARRRRQGSNGEGRRVEQRGRERGRGAKAEGGRLNTEHPDERCTLGCASSSAPQGRPSLARRTTSAELRPEHVGDAHDASADPLVRPRLRPTDARGRLLTADWTAFRLQLPDPILPSVSFRVFRGPRVRW